jgi:hypothetical protein
VPPVFTFFPRKEFVMGSRLRKFALTLLFTAVIPLAALSPSVSGTALAVDCPHGTNWDTLTQTCH